VGEEHPGRMVEQTQLLNHEEKEKILGANAMKFLGLDKEKFLSADQPK
jgi:predicted TIM-barrel fold metal-dependent hydrolase